MLIQLKDIELFTESFGHRSDPAVLLIAGATVSMLYWDERFCKLLADRGYFVIRYDNRDVGQSTTNPPGDPAYNIVDLADDAIGILDGYKIEKATFFGMSLGGLISQIVALKYPERVSSLVLMSTGPWAEADPNIPEMDKRILDFHAGAGSVDWSDEDAVVNYMLQGVKLMNGQKPFDEKTQISYIRNEFRRAKNYPSMFNHATLGGGEEYYGRLAEIDQPTLIIHGTDDLIWHFKNANLLQKQIVYSALLPLVGTGHELNEADWKLIINVVAAAIGHEEVKTYQ